MPTAPIKVLHVVTSLDSGGMENGVINVANSLDSEDFEIHVACLEREGVMAPRLQSPRQIHVLGKHGGFSVKAVLNLMRLIRRLRPHVLHSHNLGPLIYTGLASLTGTPAAILHGEHSLLTDEECSPRRLRQRRILYRACRRVHTVSEGLRQQLIQMGLPAEKIQTLLNGVDTQRFAPGDRLAARRSIDNLPGGAFVIGIVGRFGPFKRHAALIEAFNHIACKGPEIHLLMVGGGGPEEEKIRAMAQASPAAQRIHFTGFRQDPRPCYHCLDLLVVPSINEGLSNAILEAMSCGVPVLANDTCGNEEIITSGSDGVIADLGTPVLMAGEIERLMARGSSLAEIGQRARQTIIKSFSIRRMVYNYGRLYREMAGQEPVTK